jgi:hypothetical protein
MVYQKGPPLPGGIKRGQYRLFGWQHTRFGLIALGTKERVSFHLSGNRVGRNSRKDHAHATLWASHNRSRP